MEILNHPIIIFEMLVTIIAAWMTIGYVMTNYGDSGKPHRLKYYVIGRLMSIIGIFATVTTIWWTIESIVN